MYKQLVKIIKEYSHGVLLVKYCLGLIIWNLLLHIDWHDLFMFSNQKGVWLALILDISSFGFILNQ